MIMTRMEDSYFHFDRDLTDVTLACVHGSQLEAHKVVFAASSPFFMNVDV